MDPGYSPNSPDSKNGPKPKSAVATNHTTVAQHKLPQNTQSLRAGVSETKDLPGQDFL